MHDVNRRRRELGLSAAGAWAALSGARWPLGAAGLLAPPGTQAVPAAPAAPAAPTGPAARPVLLQLTDAHPDEAERSRDFASGWRLGLGDAGPAPVALRSVAVSRSAGALEAQLRDALADASVIGLAGTVGEDLALRTQALLQRLAPPAAPLALAHLAPWLSDSRYDGSAALLTLFASREDRLARALQMLRGMGLNRLDLAFGAPDQRAVLADALPQLVLRQRLHPQLLSATADLPEQLSAQLSPQTGALLLVGDTLQLHRVAQAMAARGERRFVVALGDIDLTVLRQLGSARAVPLLLPQVVPDAADAALPLVQRYQQRLRQQYEEAPHPMTLAGYIAGRYAAQLLARAGQPPTRAGLLAQVQARPAADLNGYALAFDDARRGRGSRWVRLAMLKPDGGLLLA